MSPHFFLPELHFIKKDQLLGFLLGAMLKGFFCTTLVYSSFLYNILVLWREKWFINHLCIPIFQSIKALVSAQFACEQAKQKLCLARRYGLSKVLSLLLLLAVGTSCLRQASADLEKQSVGEKEQQINSRAERSEQIFEPLFLYAKPKCWEFPWAKLLPWLLYSSLFLTHFSHILLFYDKDIIF